MSSKKSKTSDSHRLLLNRTENINVKRSDKYVALWSFSIYYTWKDIKNHIRTIYLKYKFQNGMDNLIYLMKHILYQVFKIILNICLKSMGKRPLILQ